MKYIPRALEKQLAQAARHFPAVVLTGPRRAGKTLLLRRLFPKASYFLLEDPDVVGRLRADPQGFLDELKSPKVYLTDSGLACHLLGIESAAELERSPFLGTLFEGFIAAEIAKGQVNAGRRRELYYFRDEQGLEVDFLMPGRGGSVALVECKAGRTVTPAMAAPMQRLAETMKRKHPKTAPVPMFLVHREPKAGTPTRAVAPGVLAVPWRRFLDGL